jgi:hypothetical protein
MKVAFLGFREALAYAWQKEYITEPERSKENGFAQSLPHSPPLIGNGDWRLNGVPPRHTKAYSLKKVFHLSATLDRDKFMKAPLVLLTALFIASAHQTLSGETSGDWTYSVSDNQATITGYSGAGGAVDIPAVVNEISVVKVGDGSPPIFGNGNTTVTSVTIPDSVTSIGVDAFLDCTSLESVTIPDSVTSMGDYAFYVCTSLTSVTIGNSVESIGDYAFGNCPKLTSVTIGNSVESIGDFAFLDCSSLTSITIPDSVTSIGEAAFDSCTSLTSLTIGNSVMSIGEDAFGGCSSLASITIPDSVTSIGDYAFLGCTILTSITVDAGNSNYSSVDGVLFNKLQTLLIQYPAAILDDSYTIPDGVTSIGAGAFLGCTSLTSITVDAGNSNYSSVDGVLFNKLQTLLIQYPAGILDDSYTIPDSVTSIGVAAFADCTAVTSVTIPDSVMSIGDYAFADCNNLISVTIPDSVTSIGEDAFSYCTSLTSITIPESVTSIGEYAFSNCSNLTSVTLPILFIDSYPSFSLSSEQVLLYGGTSGDWTYSVSDSQATITGYSGAGGAVDFPSVVNEFSVVAVGNGWPPIFGTGNTTMTSVTIPDSVTSIGDYAFAFCSSLTSVTIPDSVTSIGSGAFAYCRSLTSITIPDSVTSIGDYAFEKCTNLTSITIPDSVTSIGDFAFIDCTNLTSITIPDSVTSIGYYAFDDCTNLTSVTLPATLFVEGNYSDYSLSAEQVRVEKTSIDTFVANAETTARTTGQTDVTSDPATYSLYTAGNVSTAEAASRALGQTDITSDPATFSLYTAGDVSTAEATSRTLGQADVTSDPATYSLYTAGEVTASSGPRQSVCNLFNF